MRKGWEYKKLGDLCQTCSGGTPSKSHSEYYEGGKIPWLRSGEVAQGDIYKTELFITELGLANSSAKIVPPETVCVTMYGATIGEVGVIKTSMCTNQAICNILPNDYFNPHFLRYFLMGKKNWYLSIAAGGAQPNISQDVIRKTLVPTISMQTQLAIVSELDKINELIRLKKEQLVEYDNLAQSIFYEMFGDPVENEKRWEVRNIDEICSSIVRGPFGSALKKEFFVEPDATTYKVYEQKHAIQKDASIGSYYITKDKFQELSRFEVFPGDIIMSCSGTIGELYRIPKNAEKGLMNQALLKFTLKESITFPYFLFLMEYIKKGFTIRGATLQNIGSVKIIKAMTFGLPPLPLQQSFASRIEQIEKLKSEVQNAITDLETLLASRMQYWFE